MENFSSKKESREEFKYPYDAVVVLGGGLKKVGEKYYPTDYRSGDKWGMMGAGMRIAAIAELYLQKKAKRFVFTTGVAPAIKEIYGPDIPTEAKTYSEKFSRVLDGLRKREDYREKFRGLETPNVVLEDKSTSTATNIREVLKMINDSGWQRVAIVTSDYHIPRVQALYKQAMEQHPEIKTDIEFLSAEKLVEEAEPGKYDDVIAAAYKTAEARKRIGNEEKGLEDIRAGRYKLGEIKIDDKE